MNVSDAFHRYAEKVCEQIRWKKAHPAVAQEIEDHLTDQKTPTLPQEIPKALPKKRHCCRWVTLYPSVRR